MPLALIIVLTTNSNQYVIQNKIFQGFAILCCFVVLANIIQVPWFGGTDVLELSLANSFGFLRPPSMVVIYVYAIRKYGQSFNNSIIWIVFLSILLHALFAIFEYANPLGIAGLISNIYRGAFDSRLGLRALGAFSRVHGLAYFTAFSLVFLEILSLIKSRTNNVVSKLPVHLIRASFVFTILALFVSFSRSAYICLFVLFGLYVMMQLYGAVCKGVLSLRASILLLSVASLIAILLNVASLYYKDFFRWFLKSIDAIPLIFSYFSASRREQSLEFGFISGRLDHGWANALEAWRASPFFGNLPASTDSFIGDGGYTELLSNQGIIGIIGYSFFMICLLRWCHHVAVVAKRESLGEYRVYFAYLSLLPIFISVMMTAASFMQERCVELLIISTITIEYSVVFAKANCRRPREWLEFPGGLNPGVAGVERTPQ